MTGWDLILLGVTIFVSVLAALVVFVRMLAISFLNATNKLKKDTEK